jgi:P27 family predicted phage terminase small subunit
MQRRRHQLPAPARNILPSCPDHLVPAAAKEWRRVARVLHDMGVLTQIDRGALAAYCQAYGRWVEAEERLRETPMLLKTPSGYVQQSPWLGIVHKQLEIMGRYMTELGMTPAARSRVAAHQGAAAAMMAITVMLSPGDERFL